MKKFLKDYILRLSIKNIDYRIVNRFWLMLVPISVFVLYGFSMIYLLIFKTPMCDLIPILFFNMFMMVMYFMYYWNVSHTNTPTSSIGYFFYKLRLYLVLIAAIFIAVLDMWYILSH